MALLSSVSGTAQDQFIPARYAMYVSPGKDQERSISIEKPWRPPGEYTSEGEEI